MHAHSKQTVSDTGIAWLTCNLMHKLNIVDLNMRLSEVDRSTLCI